MTAVHFLAGTENFPFSTTYRSALRTNQPPIQWEPESVSSAVKQPEREADYSHPYGVHIRLHGVVLTFAFANTEIVTKFL
jgi:hypothetical protein